MRLILTKAGQFLESLFGVLPEFFKDEDKLREIWSNPETRKKLLEGLSEKGFNKEVLAEMQLLLMRKIAIYLMC